MKDPFWFSVPVIGKYMT